MMDIKELANELICGASGLGMCMSGKNNLLTAEGKKDMVAAFWKGIDFCLAHNYPSLDTLKSVFLAELNEQQVYIDESVFIKGERRVALLGNCRAEFIADGRCISKIYVKHTSKLTIKASGCAIVMVDALDDSAIEAEISDTSKVIVNLYSRASVSESCKVIHKNMETYDL